MSCSEDSLEPLAEDFFLQQLVGTWNASEIVTTGCLDEQGNGSRTCDLDRCFILTIAPDGLYILIDNFESPPLNETGVLTVGENTIKRCSVTNEDCVDDAYILSDETLTISYDDPDTECNIVVVLTRQ